MGKWKVVASAVTFGTCNKETIQRLIEAECEVVLNPYGRPLKSEEMIDFAKDADALILGNDKVPQEVMQHLPQLKIIAKHGVGVDAIDRKCAHEMGILVSNAPATNKEEVADLAFGFILDVARVLNLTENQTKAKKWVKYPGISLYQKTIGIIGVGNIGMATAKRATGFSMNILGVDLVERAEAKAIGVRYVDLETLLRESDIISLHVPLNEGTLNLLDEHEFHCMKQNVILVNTARSMCINHEALNKALISGKLFGFASDVFDYEPPCWQPYFDYTNVLITPHIGGATLQSNGRMGHKAVDNVLAAKVGKIPPNLIPHDLLI